MLAPSASRDTIDGMSDHTTNDQKTALVTGANKGIGYEIAAGLGRLGWRVGVGARDEQRREAAVDKLRAGVADAFGVPLDVTNDVTNDASVAAATGLIQERAGSLDVLVNNAGITGSAPQLPASVDLDTMRTVVETNANRDGQSSMERICRRTWTTSTSWRDQAQRSTSSHIRATCSAVPDTVATPSVARR